MFISWEKSENKKTILLDIIIGFSISLILYYFYREWVLSQQDVLYTSTYYLKPLLSDPFKVIRSTIANHGIGLFSVFKLFWILPIMYVYSQYKSKNIKAIFEIFLIIFCCYLQLFLAGDTTRMFTQSFMVIIISLKWFYESEYAYLRKYQFWFLGLNLLVPQVNTAFATVEIWNSTFLYLIESILKLF